MNGLSPRQGQALAAIRDSIERRGYPPTLRELGATLGNRSSNSTSDLLKALVRKGFIVRDFSKSRGLHIVGAVVGEVPPVTDAEQIAKWMTGGVVIPMAERYTLPRALHWLAAEIRRGAWRPDAGGAP